MITVETYNSVYEIDLENLTARRVPGNSDEARALRRDEEPVPLLAIDPIMVGRPMVMMLQIRDDGVPTCRATSAVVRVDGL